MNRVVACVRSWRGQAGALTSRTSQGDSAATCSLAEFTPSPVLSQRLLVGIGAASASAAHTERPLTGRSGATHPDCRGSPGDLVFIFVGVLPLVLGLLVSYRGLWSGRAVAIKVKLAR